MAIYGTLATDNILSIDASIADTAVDVFVYDTRKDSDGGAWRKRTQHTSWYNETLNTATRGGRREFPAVAVIVSATSSNRLTIYDGDDPDLPMWMVFTGNPSQYGAVFNNRSVVSVVAVNGSIYWADSFDSVVEVSFIRDNYISTAVSGSWNSSRNILDRNPTDTNNLWTQYDSSRKIVAYPLNDVAMTVLPSAPIDPSTGLPIPTIAVATDGGVSVIKDDGNVFDLTCSQGSYNSVTSVQFNSNGDIIYDGFNSNGGGDGKAIRIDELPSTDRVVTSIASQLQNSKRVFHYGDWYFNVGDGTSIGAVVSKGGKFIAPTNDPTDINFGESVGVSKVKLGNTNNRFDVLVSLISSSYNSGWMHGKIKGAFLSDTTAESFSATNLVSEDFSANWTRATGGVLSVSNGQLTITNSGSNGRAQSNTFATTSGKKYAFIVKAVSNSSASYRSEVRGPELAVAATGTTDGQTLVIYFNGTGNSSTYVELYAIGSSGSSATYEDAYVVEIEEDRSVNNKGLQVFGTITKSAVATGAELVAYSGFSDNANYIRQPYNPGLDFGTDDFSITCWFKMPDVSTTGFIIDRANVSSGGNRLSLYTEGSLLKFYTYDGLTTEETTSISGRNSQWIHAVAIRKSNGDMSIYLDGVLKDSVTGVSRDVTNTTAAATIGSRFTGATNSFSGSIALLRISGSAPSPEQIKKIYEDEKVLFQEGSACTLYGTSDAVTALAYDDTTELLHVGTASGRSEFKGLRRVDNTTTPVTTAISASNGLIAEQ